MKILEVHSGPGKTQLSGWISHLWENQGKTFSIQSILSVLVQD